MYDVLFGLQLVVVFQIEDRRLSKQEILSHVLLVVPILHFFGVNVVNKLFDLVLGNSWLLQKLRELLIFFCRREVAVLFSKEVSVKDLR